MTQCSNQIHSLNRFGWGLCSYGWRLFLFVQIQQILLLYFQAFDLFRDLVQNFIVLTGFGSLNFYAAVPNLVIVIVQLECTFGVFLTVNYSVHQLIQLGHYLSRNVLKLIVQAVDVLPHVGFQDVVERRFLLLAALAFPLERLHLPWCLLFFLLWT